MVSVELVLGLGVLWICSIAWVRRDAKENSSGSASLWAWVAVLFGVLGFVEYVLWGRDLPGTSRSGSGRDERPSDRCRTCGKEYFTDRSNDIGTCHSRGGTDVRVVSDG